MRPAKLPTHGIFLATAIAATAVPLAGQQPVHDWENPAVLGLNKEPPHATYTPYPDIASARDRADSPFVSSLNGIWKFKWGVF